MSRETVILSAVRTPVGKFLGALGSKTAVDLGTVAVGEAVRKAEVEPNAVEEVIMGNVVSVGLGQNPARQAALGAGLDDSVGALTVDKVCGSGLKSVILGTQAIALGDEDLVVAGGMESMSNAPYILPVARTGFRMGHAVALDSMIKDGLWCAFEDMHMGTSGEVVAEQYKIGREEQDQYAFNSHKKATEAWSAGRFKAEVVPVEVQGRRGESATIVDQDECPRADTSVEQLGKLRAVFRKGGTVTAGNAPGVNDGAAAVVLASAEKAQALGVIPLARVVAYATSGIDPKLVMMAPVEAVKKVWKKTGWSKDDVDLYELNEAFAVQALAVTRELGLDPDRVNVNGGAVAIGHPIGCSGARILVTLVHALKDRGARRGIAALCMGGGNGLAMAVERI